jgi:hypothetical protein
MKYNELTYKLGYLEATVPQDMLDLILRHGKEATDAKVSHAKNLVGQIDQEWVIPWNDELVAFVDYLSSLAEAYEDAVGKDEAPEGYRKVFPHHMFWINYQKKHEFQPAHAHNGAYSFVIWVKIPYEASDEFNLPFVKYSKDKTPGCFCFLFATPFSRDVRQEKLLVDSRYEKKIVLFPANLTHIVYPFFTSDECRISIAGNLSEPVLVPT